ncbi:MAG: toxin-antitoxin system HicB family antitoxin [Dehalococcoidia bacterium]|nr:toxin-antitoxin system HicB family antitoxin [Dehalococcoidia bacterium]
MKSTDNYTYRITWSEEDKEYIGLCAEFSSLSWLAKTQEAALQGIISLVAEAISDMQANNENIPQPITAKRFSGRLLVRIPPEVHKELTIQAAEAGVSVNRLVSAKLAKA